jgi:hypothetical protein
LSNAWDGTQPLYMDKLLTIWPAYAPAAAIVGFGLAMRTIWGMKATQITIYIGWAVFVIMGVAWEVTTPSQFWVRFVNGMFASVVAAIVFPKVLESLYSQASAPAKSAARPDSR